MLYPVGYGVTDVPTIFMRAVPEICHSTGITGGGREICHWPAGVCKEDPVLLRGEGRYTDDLNRPDQLFAVIDAAGLPMAKSAAIDLEAGA